MFKDIRIGDLVGQRIEDSDLPYSIVPVTEVYEFFIRLSGEGTPQPLSQKYRQVPSANYIR